MPWGCVFCGREKDDKTKVFMEVVPNRKAETLIVLIQKTIAPGSIIWSNKLCLLPTRPLTNSAQQTQPLAKSAPNQLGPYCTKIFQILQYRVTCRLAVMFFFISNLKYKYIIIYSAKLLCGNLLL